MSKQEEEDGMSFAFSIMVHMNTEKNTRRTRQIVTSTQGVTKLFTGNTSKFCFMYLQFFFIYIYKNTSQACSSSCIFTIREVLTGAFHFFSFFFFA